MTYEIGNDTLVFAVNSLGAELTSLRMVDDFEYMWQGSPESWTGRSPILFPIIGGLENDRYSLEGRDYQMASHGFARKKEWSLAEQTLDRDEAKRLVFEQSSDDDTRRQYPFEFRFRINYTLENTTLQIGYHIENLSDSVMPFSVGGHPGFRCPLEDDCSFNNYRLRFNTEEKTVRYLKKGKLLTGGTEPFELPDGILNLNHETFKRGAIILRDFASDSITLEREGGKRSVRVDFKGFPDLGIWTFPGKPQPFICIEPWFGVDSTSATAGDTDLRTKTGITHLPPGGRFDSRFSITV